MSSPTTYFDWSNRLEEFAKGDDSVLPDLEKGSFVVDAGTVYRFYNKVQEAYVERKKQWIDKFNRLFQIQYVRTENDISIVLQNAKGNLRPIAKFIRLTAFPDDLKATLKKDFEGFVAEIRKNVKESVSKSQPRSDKMVLVVNSFNFFDSNLESDVSADLSKASTTETTNKRRILF